MNDKNNNLTDTVNVTIHSCTLSDKVCSYAKVQRNTAYIGNVVTRILEQNKVFDRETLLYVAGLYRNAILSLLESGKAVDLFEMGTLYLKPKKGIESENPDINDIPEMALSFTPSELALRSVVNVTAGADVTESKIPVITELYDMHTRSAGNLVSPGGTIRLKGRRLKIAGDEKETGIFLAPCDETGKYSEDRSSWNQIKASELIDNSNGNLSFNIPSDIATGNYRLVVRTAYGAGTHVTKTVRTGVFNRNVIAG